MNIDMFFSSETVRTSVLSNGVISYQGS